MKVIVSLALNSVTVNYSVKKGLQQQKLHVGQGVSLKAFFDCWNALESLASPDLCQSNSSFLPNFTYLSIYYFPR